MKKQQNTRTNPSEKSKQKPAKKPAKKQTAADEARNPKTAKPAPQKTKKQQPEKKQTAKSQTAKKQSLKKSRNRKEQAPAIPVKISFLGGLNEIGKNMTMLEYDGDAIIIDCGMTFPEADLPGVDVVLPDFSYAVQNKSRIKGIVLTHAHEDHIGALPYFLKEAKLPVYGTKLTLALVNSKLTEFGLDKTTEYHEVAAGQTVKLGKLAVEFINVNHSIPDAVALAIKTPQGTVVHTGDFKIDCTPIHGRMIDLARFGELGREGVLALLCDSTNVERPGYTPTERMVGDSLANLFRKAEGDRIIVATFSSNLHRIQQIIDSAAREKRKVAISGRSMLNFVAIATELGYLKVPKNILIDIEEIRNYPACKLVIITTGSQGEPMSALTRMAFSDHRQVEVGPQDTIIISATPIPGNEKSVSRVVNELMRRGCNVVYEKMYDVHTSGHACQEELKIIHGLVRPTFFIPVHGEQRHLRKHAALAVSMGMSPKNVLVSDIGQEVSLTRDKMEVTGTVPAGRLLVDGLGIGDVGNAVLRDRTKLSQDGLIVVVASIDSIIGDLVSGPDIVTRGFVYAKEAEPLLDEMKQVVRKTLENCCRSHSRDWPMMKNRVRDELSRFVFQKTKRNPMILPVIMDV